MGCQCQERPQSPSAAAAARLSVLQGDPRCVSCCAAGSIEGDVRVSGHPKVQKTFARVMGYVEQSDIHSPNVSTPFSGSTCPSLGSAVGLGLFILLQQ